MNPYSDLSYLHLDPASSVGSAQIRTEDWEAIERSRVLQVEKIPVPAIIESMDLLEYDGLYFLRSRSTDGAEGIAVLSERASYLHPLLFQLIVPCFIGKDARDLENLLEEVYVHKNNYKLSGLALWCCVSWVEASLLDMLGKIAGVPIGELLGGVIRREVPIYVASGNRGTTPEEEVAILQQRVEETGAQAIKFKIGGRMSNNVDSMQGRSENLITLTRKTFGDSFPILADGNGSYDPQVAIQYGKMLEEINAFFYEEPCPFDHLQETKEVADQLRIPIAFGEQETSMRRFRWVVENDAAQVVQPDLQYNGGYIRNIRVARMAALKGLPVTLHISSGFGYVYMLHFASCVPNVGRYQELKQGVDETGWLFTPALQVKDGMLRVPDRPGLGMDPAAVSDVLNKARKI